MHALQSALGHVGVCERDHSVLSVEGLVEGLTYALARP